MPLYEYRCRQCGAQMEKIRKFSDPPFTTCEQCGGELEQLLSAPAFRFKGSGFYVNDYGKSGSVPGDGKGTGDKPSGDKGEKPAGKSETSPAPSSIKPAEPVSSKT